MERGTVLSAGSRSAADGGVKELSADWLPRLSDRLAAGRADAGQRRGDADLNPGMVTPEPLKEAAVLVPIVLRDDGPKVLLTQRTDHLANHPGQISFPGGRREPQDPDGLSTALRETQEETGLDPALVAPIGRLDVYITRTSYRVEPHVAVVRPPRAYSPDPYEVAEVFEVPLAFFLAPGLPEVRSRPFRGRTGQFYAFPFEHRFIWGATAGMLVNLRQVLLDLH